jgi:hypothetical protein
MLRPPIGGVTSSIATIDLRIVSASVARAGRCSNGQQIAIRHANAPPER